MKMRWLVSFVVCVGLTAASTSAASAAPRLGATVTGFVVAPAGVDGSEMLPLVQLLRWNGSSWSQREQHQNQLGGAYAFTNVAPGEYRIQASLVSGTTDTYVSDIYYGDTYDFEQATSFTVGDADVELADIHTELAGRLQGQVTDENGDPLPGRVQVSALTKDYRGLTVRRWTEADAQGRYELTRLGGGPHVVEVGGSSFSDESASGTWAVTYAGGVVDKHQGDTIDVKPGAVTTAPTLAARRNMHLTGVALDPDGEPAVGISVATDPFGGPELTTRTDDLGRWELGPLRPDSYFVSFSDAKNVYARQGSSSWSWNQTPVVLGIDGDSDVTTRLDWATPYVSHMVLNYKTSTFLPVGTTVSTTPGTWLPADTTTTVRWFRDGKPIPGATDWSYTLTEADKWRLIGPQVVGRAKGLSSETMWTESAFEASEAPVLSLTAAPAGNRKVTLTVKATSRGVSSKIFDSSLKIGRVRTGSDIISTRTINDGALKTTITYQPKGKQTYYVILNGKKHVFTGSMSAKKPTKVR